MSLVLGLLVIFLVIFLFVFGMGLGVGFLLHWLLPAIDLGVAVLIGVVTISVTSYFMMRLMSVSSSLDVDGEVKDAAMEQQPIYGFEPWSRRVRKRR